MSTIEKLSIQGVRSFGSNTEDCQLITFSSPLTLILGENGCGKTTIIECLKFALTGECPPGSDRGKNFVHDPKIFSQNESLAQIKLQVRDRCGARISICRSMKVFSRRGKITFETLDSTMNFLNNVDGKATNQDSLSGRGGDIDVAVTDFMGVSKAIINNVLFCHQEDSSWPLDEAKKLKEKFDAIFGITEYNKAIDKIIKMRKEATDKLKIIEANVNLLLHLKQEMEKRTLCLRKAQQKCDTIKKSCAQCDEEVKLIDARLLEIRSIEIEIGKYQGQKVEFETKHKNCTEQIANLLKKIKKRFQGTLEELEIEIRFFNQNMAEMVYKRSEMEESLSKLKKRNVEMQQTLSVQDKKQYVAQQQFELEQDCKLRLVKSTKALCEQLHISAHDNLIESDEGLTNILQDIEVLLLSKHSEIVEQSALNDQADQERQLNIDDLRTEVTKSVEGVTSRQKQKDAYEEENELLKLKIKQIESSMHQLKLLEKKIAETDEMYERTMKSFDQDDWRKIIAEKRISIANKQVRFKNLDEQLTLLNSISKLMAEINLKEKDFEKKAQEIHRIRSKHSDNLGKIFNVPITSNYRRSIQGVFEKLSREIKELNTKANAQQLKKQSYEMTRKNLKINIDRLEKELQESEELIYQKCHSSDYDELLERRKTAIAKLNFDYGALKSAEAMYKKYIQKINEEPCCPLCHHNMSGDEANDLTSELTDEIQKLPDNISKAEVALKAEQMKYENLLQLKPVIAKVSELKQNIPIKKDELCKVEQLIGAAVNDYETQLAMIVEPTSNLDLVNSMLGDMTLLDEAQKESARLKKDLDQLKLNLSEEYDANVSTDVLQAEKNQVFQELESERKSLDSNQQTYEKHMEALNRIREIKNTLKDQQIKLQEGVQSLPQLRDRFEEITRLITKIDTEITDLKAKIQPLEQSLRTAINEKSRLKESERCKLQELNKSYTAYKTADQDIQRLNIEAQKYAKMDLKGVIKKCDTSIKDIKEQLNTLDAEILSSTERLDALKTECLNQDSIERDLKDNRELKQLQEKEIKLNQSCQDLVKQLGNLDFRNVIKEKNELVTKKDAVSVRRGELLGQLGEINCQVERLQNEIEEPKYKDSLQNYRRAYYKMAVIRLGIEDLGQYRIALEWALIQFHAEKMEKINSLIREYWRLIYRGNDIDYIQIKTDEISTESSADRRKSYNYRVVQSKNNTEIEMRGRCSAGQRVLGSLIIRMALAETFSSNCGVLALDEPTTNLDRINIMSLCEALNRIVEERQTQLNFMILIISHDENFIQSLGKIDSYHRVFRNDESKSVIRKVHVA